MNKEKTIIKIAMTVLIIAIVWFIYTTIYNYRYAIHSTFPLLMLGIDIHSVKEYMQVATLLNIAIKLPVIIVSLITIIICKVIMRKK